MNYKKKKFLIYHMSVVDVDREKFHIFRNTSTGKQPFRNINSHSMIVCFILFIPSRFENQLLNRLDN